MAKVTRDEIVDAAVGLFFKNGYHATSMRDIARAVNIKKPSLYHHFESKEGILLAILEIGLTTLIEDIAAVVDSDQDGMTKLKNAVQAHARLIATYPQGASVIFREDRGLGDTYMARYLTHRDRIETLFRTLVQQCVEQGIFRETDLSITVHALLGMVNWMTRWYRPDGRLTAEQVADIFSDLFVNGLVTG